ncbi:MAG: hypothetical protein IKG40_01355 [Bacilli bacterium]|nr:hypothetical protein [Bacilli bacterium]
MNSFYPYILGITDTLNDWNEKLSGLVGEKMGQLGTGVFLMFLLIGAAVWGIHKFNKR